MAALTSDTVLLQRYQLLAPIADRGLGETWEGLDARLEGRRVLVKVLEHCEDYARKKVVARLQALRKFRHPGALAVTDHGVHDGRPFIVHDMPMVGSLATVIDRYRAGEIALSLEKIAALVARLAEVVNAGHDAPGALVHGALRPRAVLVPDDLDAGQMVLLDVGLRDLGSDPDAPKDSAAAARCLTPEQLEGEPLVPRTDTFALGLLALEILRAPPAGATPASPRYLGRPDVPDGVWTHSSSPRASRSSSAPPSRPSPTCSRPRGPRPRSSRP
jgi:serine/threonine-protein kinase